MSTTMSGTHVEILAEAIRKRLPHDARWSVHTDPDHDAVEFDWNGNDEMDEACGDGWAELQPDGSLDGENCFHGGDDISFTARRWSTSSTPC